MLRQYAIASVGFHTLNQPTLTSDRIQRDRPSTSLYKVRNESYPPILVGRGTGADIIVYNKYRVCSWYMQVWNDSNSTDADKRQSKYQVSSISQIHCSYICIQLVSLCLHHTLLHTLLSWPLCCDCFLGCYFRSTMNSCLRYLMNI